MGNIMKKNGKKWRQLQKEKEECRASLEISAVPKELQEFVCTHYGGIPFKHYRKLKPKKLKYNIFIGETPRCCLKNRNCTKSSKIV